MPSVTLSNLQSRVYSRIDNNTLLYEAADVTAAINEAIRITNAFIGYIQVSVEITTRKNQTWYPVPAPILIPFRLTFEGMFLESRSLNNMGQLAGDWPRETTGNTGIQVSRWVTNGLDKFAINPADSLGGNTLLLTGVAEPTLLVSGTDTIQIPDEYSEALEDMAFIALVLKEGGKIMADGIKVYQTAIQKLQQFSRFQQMRQPAKVPQVSQRR